jgi:hypothetical protein
MHHSVIVTKLLSVWVSLPLRVAALTAMTGREAAEQEKDESRARRRADIEAQNVYNEE